MTAPTAAVQYLLAKAALRNGLMHIVSQRDTGALNPVCGANPVRSREISTWTQAPADLTALCADCAALAEGLPGVETIEQGLAVFVGAGVHGSAARLLEVPLDAIHVAAGARMAAAELVDSVRVSGVIQPIVARRTSNGLHLVSGARRLHAARAAGLDTIPTVVRDAGADQLLIEQLLDNLHREDLDPIAQAHAYRRALEQLQITQKDLAKRLAISQPQVSNTLRLLALPAEIQQHITTGALGAAHARELLAVTDDADRAALATQILTEGLTVRETVARRAASTPAVKLGDVGQLLAALLAAKVLVTTRGDRARITIDVPEADLARVLEQVGGATALAA